jgi:hypothetical protein
VGVSTLQGLVAFGNPINDTAGCAVLFTPCCWRAFDCLGVFASKHIPTQLVSVGTGYVSLYHREQVACNRLLPGRNCQLQWHVHTAQWPNEQVDTIVRAGQMKW